MPSAPALVERYLTLREREEIAIDLALGTGIRAIALKLARSPSTISREVRRNAATRSGTLDYRAGAAQWRSSRFTMLLHLPRMEGYPRGQGVKNGAPLAGHGAQAVRKAITGSMRDLPETLRQSLTWDQGAEMAQHARLRVDSGLAIGPESTETGACGT